jgi:hypothetical protein
MRIHIAIPACDEEQFLPRVLESLSQETYKDFVVWVCINQPESWWNDPNKIAVCESNQRLLHFLQSFKSTYPFELRVLDCASRGKGWSGDKWGASLARKTLMDLISAESGEEDMIMSLDADTLVDEHYVSEGMGGFLRFPRAAALTFAYYHKLEGDENLRKSMIRYETYLRNYFLGLLNVKSPYSYVPIGSAFAVKVWAYKAVRGMPLRAAGEDFYFLQKVRQVGFVLPFPEVVVYPAGRLSHRVLFGTGRALTYSFDELCQRYPLFPSSSFQKLQEIYLEIQEVASTRKFEKGMLLCKYVSPAHISAILENYKQPRHIEHALHIQFNALEIYHLLKNSLGFYDEKIAVADFLERTGLECSDNDLWDKPLPALEEFRKKLFEYERKFVRKKIELLQRKNKSWWKYLTCW